MPSIVNFARRYACSSWRLSRVKSLMACCPRGYRITGAGNGRVVWAEVAPREKLLKYGAAVLTDAELLAIFLRTSIRNACYADG